MIDIFLATRMARRDNAGGDCVLLMKHWTVTAQASSTWELYVCKFLLSACVCMLWKMRN